MSNTNSEVNKLAENTASVVNQVLNEVVRPVVQQVIPSVNSAFNEVSLNDVKLEEKNQSNTDIVEERTNEVVSNKSPLREPVIDELFETALAQLQKRVGLTEVNAQSLILIVKYAMEVVEMSDLKGTEQREFALRLIKRVIIDASLNDDDEEFCLDMVKSGAVGQTIDLVVDATNGQLNVNSAVRLAENCCFTFLSSRKNRRSKRQNRK